MSRATILRVDPTCPECRTAVAVEQRYCLVCGHRVGELRVDWRALLAPRSDTATGAAAVPATTALPTPRVAATLMLIVMGFGVVVAGATSSAEPPARASAARGPLTIVLPPKAVPAPVAEQPAPVEPAATPGPAPEPDPLFVAEEPTEGAPEAEAEDEATVDEPVDTGPDVPAIDNVFVISLGPGTYDQWFGEATPVPYLTELAEQGTLLSGYEATADGELANAIALISGQPATAQTDANCPVYSPVSPGTVDEDGIAQGDGCFYPLDAYTLPDQLVAQGATWKAYIESQDAPDADPATCRHPQDGQPDPYSAPRDNDRYVTWRNPFVYFQTITTSSDCATDDVGLTPLADDLAKLSTTAGLTWIAPNVDNHGPATAEAWLRMVIPTILDSEAYAKGALIAIVPDASGVSEDRRTGALLLGEHVPAGSISTESFTHLSLLKGIEDLFGLRYLAGAQDEKVKSFVSLLLH